MEAMQHATSLGLVEHLKEKNNKTENLKKYIISVIKVYR